MQNFPNNIVLTSYNKVTVQGAAASRVSYNKVTVQGAAASRVFFHLKAEAVRMGE